jgi:hypothetical protein
MKISCLRIPSFRERQLAIGEDTELESWKIKDCRLTLKDKDVVVAHAEINIAGNSDGFKVSEIRMTMTPPAIRDLPDVGEDFPHDMKLVFPQTSILTALVASNMWLATVEYRPKDKHGTLVLLPACLEIIPRWFAPDRESEGVL